MTHPRVSHGEWLARFDGYLHQQGYRARTIHRYRTVCQQFLRYLDAHAITLEQVAPATLEAYVQFQRQRYLQQHGHAPHAAHHRFNRGITGLLRLVHGHWPPPTPLATPRERFQQQVGAGYAQWLAHARGLTPRTIAVRQARGQKFLAWLGEQGTPERLHDLTVADLDAYLAAQVARLRRSTRADLTCSLRDFLRYLYAHGLIARDLASAVMSPTLYAFERLPAALTPDEVQAVLKSARQDHTPLGLRNYAILLLLATYGLRAGEVVRLRLEDLDWRHECLHVRQSKTGRTTVLPLLAPVGDAILAYLREGRPTTAAREVFLRAQAPIQPFRSGSSLYAIVARRLPKAGVRPAGKRGPHTFRHAHAVRLLRAAVPLKAIGDLLGHTATASTAIYLKLAVEDLREVGLDVPPAREELP
jgi:integrase/recombinase XerD